MIAQQRSFRFTWMPFAALALVAVLLFLIAGTATPALAAGTPDWQQMPGNSPMTHTMPMSATTPPLADHSMHQGQGMMGQGMMQGNGMMDAMPMHQAGMADKMVTMGRHMQMMGTMMQMMGQMHGMMEGMMQGGMMQGGMMGQGMMQGTMPMTGTMPMGKGMGMMGGGMMAMPMTEMPMTEMHAMMGQMMDQMMADMHELHMMHQGMGAGPAAMDHAKPVTQTVPLTQTGPLPATTRTPAADSPQRAQVGAVEIIVSALNLQAAEAETLDFAVAFNSHTEAIAIDLAKQAKLQIGTVELTPTAWETDSPEGHHIKGVLRFAPTAESKEALAAATAITLVISGLPDDAEATFTWEVTTD